MVLAHGFTQTGDSFEEVAEGLASCYEVVLVDLPYHGRSAGAPAADISHAARLLAESCGSATYVGYSMGGRICLELALAEPDRVRALVLVSTTAGVEDAVERRTRIEADCALARHVEDLGDVRAFLDEWLSQPLFAELPRERADLESRLANEAPSLAASLIHLGTGTMQARWDRLGEIVVPALVVAGERDTKFTALAERIATGIGPSATLAIVEGAGHAVPFERPAAFLDRLRHFLAEHRQALLK